MMINANRHQIDNQRAPQSEGDGNRQTVFNQRQHRGAAKQAIAKIKADVVPEHFEVTFVDRLIKTVAMSDLSDHFWI